MQIPELYSTVLLHSSDHSSHFTVCYNCDHPLYDGHFPGLPVTPGVCLIQTATELMASAVGSPLCLIGARQIKFLQMHTPEKPLRFELFWSQEESGLNGRIQVFQNDICIAKIYAQFEQTS